MTRSPPFAPEVSSLSQLSPAGSDASLEGGALPVNVTPIAIRKASANTNTCIVIDSQDDDAHSEATTVPASCFLQR